MLRRGRRCKGYRSGNEEVGLPPCLAGLCTAMALYYEYNIDHRTDPSFFWSSIANHRRTYIFHALLATSLHSIDCSLDGVWGVR